ncbi:hypothetical protein D918_02699 [Trichuris suis]|nr:hypothetical protein D918_02699 [Trichuris suis]
MEIFNVIISVLAQKQSLDWVQIISDEWKSLMPSSQSVIYLGSVHIQVSKCIHFLIFPTWTNSSVGRQANLDKQFTAKATTEKALKVNSLFFQKKIYYRHLLDARIATRLWNGTK